MIKLVCFLRRKPGMSRDDFHGHWLESHGPLIARTPELAQHLVRYEQNHRLDADYARDPEGEPGFDGATVQWLDSFRSFTEFVREPAYAELIAPDEASFLDRDSLTLLFTDDDDVKIAGARTKAEVKLLCLIARKPGLTPEAFHEHWAGPHARIFQETAELSRHIVGYHQSHRLAKDYDRDAEGFDGLAEQWYESLAHFQQMVAEPSVAERVTPDEERFIDRPRLTFVLSRQPDVIIG